MEIFDQRVMLGKYGHEGCLATISVLVNFCLQKSRTSQRVSSLCALGKAKSCQDKPIAPSFQPLRFTQCAIQTFRLDVGFDIRNYLSNYPATLTIPCSLPHSKMTAPPHVYTPHGISASGTRLSRSPHTHADFDIHLNGTPAHTPQILVEFDPALFKDHHDAGAAEFEDANFLALFDVRAGGSALFVDSGASQYHPSRFARSRCFELVSCKEGRGLT